MSPIYSKPLASLGLTIALLFAGMPARADTASEAELQFELGSELYKQGRYVEAIERFIASNRLAPNANVVLNVAQTFAFLKRPLDTYNWYSTYLAFDLPPDKRAQAEATQSELASQLAVVEVSTEPSSAELFVDRTELGSVGRSPRRIAVEPGSHEIIARSTDHHDATASVVAQVGGTQSTRLNLIPLTGTLSVRTDPPGVSVRMEGTGRELGRTPLRVTLPVGEVHIELSLHGYVDGTRTVAIADGKEALLEAKLAREASSISVLSVQGNIAGAEVFLDQARLGSAPLSIADLRPGPHQIEIRAPARETWSSTALLEPGASTQVDFRLADPSDRTWPGFRWLGYGVGGALLIGGAVSGALALDAHSEFNAEPSRSTLDRVHHLNTTADVLFVSGGVVVATTLVWSLLSPPPPHSAASVTIHR